MLTKSNIKDVYNLTPMQEGMLIAYARNNDDLSHIEQFTFTLECVIDETILTRSLKSLVDKYDTLRSIFSFRKTDTPKQVVVKDATPMFVARDISGLRSEDIVSEIHKFLQEDRNTRFDLSAELLIRFALFKCGEQCNRLIISFHHIILDGWSMNVLIGDLFDFYSRHSKDAAPEIADIHEPFPYCNYIRWIDQQDKDEAKSYWSEYLSGYESPVGAPYFDSPEGEGVEHAREIMPLGFELSQKLRDIAMQNKVTVNSVFQAAWGVALQKYNNTNDVVFGSVVSGRSASVQGIGAMVGMFINTQPIRVKSNQDDTFIELARRVHRDLFYAIKHEYYPLAAIQKSSPLKNHLLNHVVTFENLPVSEQMKSAGEESGQFRIRDVDVYQAAKFDFQLIVYPGDEIEINFVFNKKVFSQQSVEMLARSLNMLLVSVTADPQKLVREIEFCSTIDREKIIHEYNNTKRTYPHESSVVETFVRTMMDFPEQTALRDSQTNFSYKQLSQIAAFHAESLFESGVKSCNAVAVLAPRSVETVIAMLSVLYCGATYVPVDPASSHERIAQIMEDCEASIIICTDTSKNLLPDNVTPYIISHDVPLSSTFTPVQVKPTDAAYIIFTSGSTGKPKGCAVSHKNILRLVKNTDFVDFHSDHRILQTCSPAFDVCTAEVWGALLNGSQLCIVDDDVMKDPARIRNAIKNFNASCFFTTTALFNQLVDFDVSMFTSLEYLMIGGEALSPSHTERARQNHPQLTIINGYGPTENTAVSTAYIVREKHKTAVPIGKPIANSTAYILDESGNLMPPGAYGEICLGGDGVAIGYINRAELTAQHFIADPFNSGKKLYRTGDIGRWNTDGNLHIKGRNDFQVKVRGFRVELGEIERCMIALPFVSEAVVLAQGDSGNKQLVAFFTLVEKGGHTEEHIKQSLASKLPAYMVPNYLMELDSMPINANGKIDRIRLPAGELTKRRASVAVPPRNKTESDLTEICREVLGISEINIHDNFFDLGADSINLMAINNRLNKLLERELPLTTLFEYTSIASLAEHLNQDEQAEAEKQKEKREDLVNAKQKLLKTRNLMKVRGNG